MISSVKSLILEIGKQRRACIKDKCREGVRDLFVIPMCTG